MRTMRSTSNIERPPFLQNTPTAWYLPSTFWKGCRKALAFFSIAIADLQWVIKKYNGASAKPVSTRNFADLEGLAGLEIFKPRGRGPRASRVNKRQPSALLDIERPRPDQCRNVDPNRHGQSDGQAGSSRNVTFQKALTRRRGLLKLKFARLEARRGHRQIPIQKTLKRPIPDGQTPVPSSAASLSRNCMITWWRASAFPITRALRS